MMQRMDERNRYFSERRGKGRSYVQQKSCLSNHNCLTAVLEG
jgi:hypothetical protein